MIPFYKGGVYVTEPSEFISLGELLNMIWNPPQELKDHILKIHEAANNNNEKLKHKLKAQLPFFTPAVNCSLRKYENINYFTQIMPFDFDKLSHEDAIKLKHELIKYPFVIASWLSSSGKGVRGLVAIPQCKTIHEYKLRFKALQQKFKIYNGFDMACQNPVLPLFYSYDYDMCITSDFDYFTDKYVESKLPKVQNIRIYSSYDDENKVIDIISNRFNKIVDQGHYIVRAASYAMGGYVAAGYIMESTAIDVIDRLIDNHSYLLEKTDTYKKTIRTMIKKGQSEKLEL
jgi:hypothetical protein